MHKFSEFMKYQLKVYSKFHLPALTATRTRGEPYSGKYILGFTVTHSHRSRRQSAVASALND